MDVNIQTGTARDPVCWMDVDPKTASFSFEHEGETFFFCSRGCMLDFSEQPEHYLSPTYQSEGMDDMRP